MGLSTGIFVREARSAIVVRRRKSKLRFLLDLFNVGDVLPVRLRRLRRPLGRFAFMLLPFPNFLGNGGLLLSLLQRGDS